MALVSQAHAFAPFISIAPWQDAGLDAYKSIINHQTDLFKSQFVPEQARIFHRQDHDFPNRPVFHWSLIDTCQSACMLVHSRTCIAPCLQHGIDFGAVQTLNSAQRAVFITCGTHGSHGKEKKAKLNFTESMYNNSRNETGISEHSTSRTQCSARQMSTSDMQHDRYEQLLTSTTTFYCNALHIPWFGGICASLLCSKQPTNALTKAL